MGRRIETEKGRKTKTKIRTKIKIKRKRSEAGVSRDAPVPNLDQKAGERSGKGRKNDRVPNHPPGRVPSHARKGGGRIERKRRRRTRISVKRSAAGRNRLGGCQ